MAFSIRTLSFECLATIAILCVIQTPTNAGLCIQPVVQKEIPYQYLVSLTDAFSYAKSGLDRFPGRKDERADAGTLAFETFLDLKLAKADLECAASQISPYSTSADRSIKRSAEVGAVSFTLLADLLDKLAADYKVLHDSPPQGHVKYETLLANQAERAAAFDEAWKMLIPAATAATYSVVEEDPQTGLMWDLALTMTQRDDIRQRLRTTFGEEVTKGMKAGQLSLVAAAAVLYEGIGNQPRKPITK